jgi:hypothetical protein
MPRPRSPSRRQEAEIIEEPAGELEHDALVTGVFFGVEIILREFSIDALFTVMVSAMLADVVAIGFLGGRPFLAGSRPASRSATPGITCWSRYSRLPGLGASGRNINGLE